MSEAMAWVDAVVPSPVSMDEAQEESLRFSAVVGEVYAMANESDGPGRAMRAIAALLAADRADLIAESEGGDLLSRQEVVIRRTSRHQWIDARICGGAQAFRLRIERHRQWPRFDEGEVRIVRMLVPHLNRALALREQLAARRSSSIEFELELLSKLGVAVAVVDASLSLICSNEAARQVLAASDGILVEKQQLFASSAASTIRLRNAVQNVVEGVSNLSTVVVDWMIADTPLHVTVVAAHTAGRALLVIAGRGPSAGRPGRQSQQCVRPESRGGTSRAPARQGTSPIEPPNPGGNPKTGGPIKNGLQKGEPPKRNSFPLVAGAPFP